MALKALPIASVAAITALVLFCSRVYTRRAVHGLRSRKLAKSEDNEALVRTCAGSSDEDGEQEPHGQPHENGSVGLETHLPLKKRLLARVAQAGRDDVLSSPQQQRQQLTPEVQTSREFGLRTGLLAHGPHQHAGQSSSHALQTSLQVWEQRPPLSGMQPELHRLQQQLPINPPSLQQQHSHVLPEGSEPYQKQQQHLLLQWPQKQLQQSLPHLRRHESLLQKQGKQLLQPMERQVGMQDSEQQQALPEKRQQAKVQDDSDEQPSRKKRKREEQTEPNARKEQLQPVVEPECLEEDAWLASGTLGSHEPEHSKQQALKSPTEVAVAGPSTSAHPTVQATPGSSVPCIVTLPADTAAGDSEDETSAARASGTAAANAAAAIDRPHAGLASAASRHARRGMSLQVPVLSSLLTGGRMELGKAKIVAGGSAVASATPTSVSTPALVTKLPSKEDFIKGALEKHPYARLPTRVVENVPLEFQVNLERAVTRTRRRRHPIHLLRKAHNLLLLQCLFPMQLKELAETAENLIAHSMEYQSVDVSGHLTCRAVERLALRFLIMDVVVSTMIVLGQSEGLINNEHWNRFTSAVSHAGPPPIMRYYPGRPQFFSGLAQQLTCAIQTLKTGIRPSAKELVKLKRKLFCLELSPVRLQTEDFEPWRQDDACRADGL
ncbi:hypothetical protein EMWEY_00015010 [Eimeria maxima]|uniref:Uncharacterized protein n=1 Tax=Eimeria maxima TaxID=5804 RepID=U6M2R8_EIMMA|nr:hypothetical protein EMWEY_00015010 [Eimeria maxima]CDJ58311.1 hypothetical protein EMWEY_00015010 [Eimeria maxima]